MGRLMRPGSWHTGTFLAFSGLAVALICTGPDPDAPGIPRSDVHESRWEILACPECHDTAALPAVHSDRGRTLRPGYSRCYLCHR